MDEDFLSWLLLIPGVGRRRAERLAGKFPSVAALRDAGVADIAAVEGIGDVLAERVKDYVAKAAPGVDRQYRDEPGLYLCPGCGSLIGKAAKECPFCNTVLEGEEPASGSAGSPSAAPEERLEREGQSLNLCPNCGSLVGPAASACPQCGAALDREGVAEEPELPSLEGSSDGLEAADQGLYLCPACGALIGAGADVCPRCGTAVEGEEETAPAEAEAVAELPPEAITGAPSLFTCTNCGAFLRAEDTQCPSCGVQFEEGAIADSAPSLEAEATAFFPICANCGALVPSTAKKCSICGHRMGEPAPARPAEVAPGEIGITRDFLERWRRVAEEKAGLTPERGLLQELEQFDQFLAADPTLERVWLKKAGVLLRLGRVAESIACYEKLSDLNPAKDEEYRLQVQSILRIQDDMSLLPRRWSAVRATEAPPAIAPPEVEAPKTSRKPAAVPVERAVPAASKIQDAIDFYDRLLQVDPSLLVGWQTKAELLERLGRTAEAEAARRRAQSLSRGTGEGMRTTGPRTARRAEGRVNGMGRTNGRINGTGRVNGRGQTNGIVSSAGRNGMTSGFAPGGGMVNGLINGNGFTNGRRGRKGAPGVRTEGAWARSVIGIASVVLLLLLMPILATLISTSPPPGGMEIDGKFADWQGTREYTDLRADEVANPDVNLDAWNVRAVDDALFVYARVNGSLFRASSGGADSVFAFVDEDGNSATGFQIGALGAERAVEFYGWDSLLRGTQAWGYDSSYGVSSDDWRSLAPQGGVTAASDGRQVEARIDSGSAPPLDRARILIHTLDGAGHGDAADAVVGTTPGALAVTQTSVAGEVITGTQLPVLAFAIRPLAASIAVASVTVRQTGSLAPGAVSGDLFLDANGDGVLQGTDPLLATGTFAPTATFPLNNVTLDTPRAYILRADLVAPVPNASVGFRVERVTPVAGSAIPVTLTDANLTMSYVNAAPANITIDGAFADWNRFARRLDPIGDVQSITYNGTLNQNIDLREFEAVVGTNVSVYMRVDGRMFGGVDLPTSRARPVVSNVIDSDGDGVPDDVERLLGPILPYDFNNDNVSDANQAPDVDQDGVWDYNQCAATDCSAYTDYFLNATIPAWYPPPYAGSVVRRYIGPVSPPPERGVDTAIVYVDRDNRTDTGLYVTVGGVGYGMDYAFQAVGRGGKVVQSGLYRYNGTLAIPWELVAAAPVAIDNFRLEASLDGAALNLTANRTFLFYTTDWQFNFDNANADAGTRRVPGAGTRSLNGTGVVINELSPRPNPEWVELANPGASAVNLNGWTLESQRGGGGWTTIYTYTQTIGAWGSGAEYLAVTLGLTSLPNGGATIRLRAANGTEIDRTSYQGVNNGQSWSRFKHATTGKPVDTDNDGNDFYADTMPTRGGPNTRHRPLITVAKTANRASAAPGDLITYTIYYNNTDTGRANRVWVNDTLPANVAFQSSSVGFQSTDGKTYRWVFTNVNPVSLNSFTIIVRVNATVPNGAVLRNAVGLNYTDQLNRLQPASVATANTNVLRPVIVVRKIVNRANAVPGDTLVYTVFYNNTGGAIANHVWLNDTLPIGVTYVTANPAPTSRVGQNLFWHFTNVAVGAHSLTITVTVNANPPSVLVNWAFLNYTAQNNYKLVGSQDSALTRIPEFRDLLVPMAIPILLIGLRRRWGKKEG